MTIARRPLEGFAFPEFLAAAFAVCACALALVLSGAPAAAQTATPDRTPPAAAGEPSILSPDGMRDAIRKARESGTPVIVVSPEEGGGWSYRDIAGAEEGENPYEALARRGQTEVEMLDKTQTGVAAFHSRLGQLLERAPQAWPQILATLKEASPNGDPYYFAWVLLVVLAGLAIGMVIEKFHYGVRLVGPWFVAQQQAHPEGFVEKLPILALRIALTIGGVAISTIVALLLGLVFYEPHAPTQKTALLILATYAVIRVVNAIWRMLLSPYLPNYRIPALDDREARVLFQWMTASTTFAFATLSACVWFEAMGLAKDAHVLMTSGASLLTVLINLALIRANRIAVAQAILGERSSARSSVLARIGAALWAPFFSLYLIVAWSEMTYRLVMDQPLGPPLIVGAYVILTALMVTYGGIAYLIEWVFKRRRRPMPELDAAGRIEAAEPELAADVDPTMTTPMFAPTSYRMSSMEDLARRVASIFAILAGAFALLWIWSADAMLSANTFMRRGVDVATILLIGYIVYHSVRIAIDQRIEEEGGDFVVTPGGEGGEGAAASRLATLLPLFRNFLLVTIVVVTLMMLLLETGINVTPLFAGAGVVGLAIGFGAQALVRDIFSGAFFLIDDAFRKGEYIDIGEVKGTVEKISVRSFQLRHHLGYLHTIPFGEVKHLTNYSRDWVMMKLPLRLTYDTDVEKVRKLVKKLGQQLLEDPEIGHQFMEPLKSQGVYMMEDSAMIIRVKFMCKPGDQWVIRKKVYAAIRELFERENIRFAHREVTVRLAEEPARPLTDQDKERIAGAVRPTLDPPEGEGRAPAMAGGDDR